MEDKDHPIISNDNAPDEERVNTTLDTETQSPAEEPQHTSNEEPQDQAEETSPAAEEPAEPEPQEPSAPAPTPSAQDLDRPRKNIFESIGNLMKSTSHLLRTIIILAVVLLVAWGIFSLQHRAKHKRVVRAITQTVVEVQKIKEFCTANYQEETVVVAHRKKLLKSEDLAIIVKGTVRVGFDLSQMNTQLTSDTSIVIDLPAPIVLDVITNPSNFETFEEEGHWDHKQVTTYKNMARAMILHHAKADGIMQDAVENGVAKLTLLFKRMGMKQVTVNVAQPEPTPTESGVPYVGGVFKNPEKQDPAI